MSSSPHRLAAIVVLVLAALALPALAAGSAPSVPRAQHDPQIADGTLQRGLDSARKRWNAAHVRSYRYAITTTCFCVPGRGIVYVVRNGHPHVPSRGEKSLATVPRLFKTIQAASVDNVASLDVAYGARGVPKSISIDNAANVADDEVAYAISGFRRLT
jgi:hypothetical protein